MLQTFAVAIAKRAKQVNLAKGITVSDLLSTMRGAAKRQYHVFADADSRTQIDTVRRGLPARFLSAMSADMQVSKEQLFDWTNIARATANRKIAADVTLTVEESERAFCVAKLIGLVATMVGNNGEAGKQNANKKKNAKTNADATLNTAANAFDAAKWTANWLGEANHALGGAMPGEYLDTAEGRALVAQLITQIESGVYA